MRHETEVAIRAVEKAIKMADSREGADKITSKGGIDLVTNTDMMCEDVIRAELTGAFPDYAIHGEERGGSLSEGRARPRDTVGRGRAGNHHRIRGGRAHRRRGDPPCVARSGR